MAKTSKPAREDKGGVPAAAAGDNWAPLETETVEMDFRTLRPQTLNARFMTTAQMSQLRDNIRRDGRLTSAPLAYRDPDGDGSIETLSGHHRAEAAIAAEVYHGPVIIIVSKLSEQRKRAIQLSHNAIVGQDDQSTLAAMYAGLDLGAKSYSGLDDTVLAGMAKISLAGLGVSMKYQDMTLFFLSEDAKVVADAMPKIEAAARKRSAYVASYADFDRFFDLMVRAKAKFQAFNSGIVFRLLIDLAEEGLARLDEPEDVPE